MAFDQSNFAPVGGQSRRGKAPMVWSYATEDALADVDGAGYFDNGATANTGMRNLLKPGDLIHVVVVSDLTADPWTVSDAGLLVVNANASGIIDTANETALTTATDSD
jgi:hypothetical protein